MYKNFSNYDVCEDGRIWSKKRKKWMKPYKQRDGYLLVNLFDNDRKKHTVSHHKVVFFAVNGLWEYPQGMEINHKDEDKTNNHIDNLELVTKKQNINYGTRNEKASKALTNHPKKSKRVAAYNENGELVMVFDSMAEANRNGYQHSAVSRCCRNCFHREGNNKYKGFVWKYLDE